MVVVVVVVGGGVLHHVKRKEELSGQGNVRGICPRGKCPEEMFGCGSVAPIKC